MWELISRELKHHAPFTVFGALTGIIAMVFFYNVPYKTAYNVFYTLHPIHVFLSALVTASMYRNYKCAVDRRRCNLMVLLIVGFTGAIGIATMSDAIVPYLGEVLLKLEHAELHIGFIEEWWRILPLAGIGVVVAYYRPSTKVPHAGHVLISTWASLFHMIMAAGRPLDFFSAVGIFVFLFLAVWAPCCISDIVFPLLFVNEKK